MAKVVRAQDVEGIDLMYLHEDVLPYLSEGPLKRLITFVYNELNRGNDIIVSEVERL